MSPLHLERITGGPLHLGHGHLQVGERARAHDRVGGGTGNRNGQKSTRKVDAGFVNLRPGAFSDPAIRLNIQNLHETLAT